MPAAPRRAVARMLRALWLALCLAAPCGPVTAAEPLVLLVQPPPWPGDVRAFDPAPLAALIAGALQRPVQVLQPADALSHWRAVRRPEGYQMALDEAHFSAWRIRHRGFTALARAAGDVRFVIAVRPGTLITSPTDLSARAVAVPAPPALAAVRLQELFDQPVRGPEVVALRSRDEALKALGAGRVDAVVMEGGDDEVVPGGVVALVTDASPGRGFSVSDAISADARRELLRALRAARDSAVGRRALAAVGLEALEPASNEAFEDSERLLRGTWGYR